MLGETMNAISVAAGISRTIVESPIGRLGLEARGPALVRVWFGAEGSADRRPDSDVLLETVRQLEAYWARRLRQFDVPLAPEGTPFQRDVWAALQTIPFGETWSYAELARRIGRPAAIRAVGAANGRNPIPILIPCHRVIGSNGALVGFGGGLGIKRALLDIERDNRLPIED
jgi:methylated-DNA-[protein]-cysteine S-methyltransferase